MWDHQLQVQGSFTSLQGGPSCYFYFYLVAQTTSNSKNHFVPTNNSIDNSSTQNKLQPMSSLVFLHNHRALKYHSSNTMHFSLVLGFSNTRSLTKTLQSTSYYEPNNSLFSLLSLLLAHFSNKHLYCTKYEKQQRLPNQSRRKTNRNNVTDQLSDVYVADKCPARVILCARPFPCQCSSLRKFLLANYLLLPTTPASSLP